MKKLIMAILFVFTFASTAFANYPKYLYDNPDNIFIGEVNGLAVYVIKSRAMDGFEGSDFKLRDLDIMGGNCFIVKFYEKNGELRKNVRVIPGVFNYETKNGNKRMYADDIKRGHYLSPNTQNDVDKLFLLFGEAVYRIKRNVPFYDMLDMPDELLEQN